MERRHTDKDDTGMLQRQTVDISDQKVREMLIKSGVDVLSPDEVNAYARLMRALFAEYEAKNRSRDTLRTALIAVGTGIIVALIPVVLHLLKVI